MGHAKIWSNRGLSIHASAILHFNSSVWFCAGLWQYRTIDIAIDTAY